jgi:proteasome activator subunit 4
MCTIKAHRLTPSLRRAFVDVLRTPALLAMFSKDSFSISMAQGALRTMALLEPTLIMPELLERAYGGLEVVNETHRTTAVLKMLSGISLPLVSETIWRPGQKHLLPLLELCLPGIDLVRYFTLSSRVLVTHYATFRMTPIKPSVLLYSSSAPCSM